MTEWDKEGGRISKGKVTKGGCGEGSCTPVSLKAGVVVVLRGAQVCGSCKLKVIGLFIYLFTYLSTNEATCSPCQDLANAIFFSCYCFCRLIIR